MQRAKCHYHFSTRREWGRQQRQSPFPTTRKGQRPLECAMPDPPPAVPLCFDRRSAVHVARSAIATIASLLCAQLFRLPEAYWAAVTTIVVMQSTLGAALPVSIMRFVGTLIGAAAGALLASQFGASGYAFGAGLLLLGMVIAAVHLDRSAYRFAGITLADHVGDRNVGAAERVAMDRGVPPLR